MFTKLKQETIKSYLPKDFLFEGQDERVHISERRVQAVFQRAVKAAEIK